MYTVYIYIHTVYILAAGWLYRNIVLVCSSADPGGDCWIQRLCGLRRSLWFTPLVGFWKIL